jgi:L-lactate dehydrogenase (cytochrome)
MPEHPGGPKVILKYAGKDATEEYEPIHPPDTLDKFLDKSKHLGEVDMKTVEKEDKAEDPDEQDRLARVERMPILEQCYNLMDFEAVAKKVMKKTAWAYYSSGADDEIVSFIGLVVSFQGCESILTFDYQDSPREPLSVPQNLVQT